MNLELLPPASTSGPSNNISSFAADFSADFAMPPPPHGTLGGGSTDLFGDFGAAEPFTNAFDGFAAAPASTPPKAALTAASAPSGGGGDGGDDDDGDFGDFAEFSGSPKPALLAISAAPTAPAELIGWLLQQERFGEAAQLQAHTAATEKLEAARAAYRDESWQITTPVTHPLSHAPCALARCALVPTR
jgi:hypothetical protein